MFSLLAELLIMTTNATRFNISDEITKYCKCGRKPINRDFSTIDLNSWNDKLSTYQEICTKTGLNLD